MKTIICPSCKKQIDLKLYNINPRSHVINGVVCECGRQITFIPDEDCLCVNINRDQRVFSE